MLDISSDELLSFVISNPKGFRKKYPSRNINNIYFDSYDFSLYNDHIDGISERQKIRIRWYETILKKAVKPKIEYKQKIGLVNQKLIYDIQDFDFKPGLNMHTLLKSINHSDLPETVVNDFKTFNPVLYNTYHRSYFENYDQTVRITIDQNIKYCQIGRHNNTLSSFMNFESMIMELKYAPEYSDQASSIMSKFPFRLSKHSKYATGVECLFS